MLKEGDRIKVYGSAGSIIDFIPRRGYDDVLDAVVQLDGEISFNAVRGKTLVMQLMTVGNNWGADHDILRAVTVHLCPNLDSWFQGTGCEQLDSHLVYELL
jgi:hypothetical protein